MSIERLAAPVPPEGYWQADWFARERCRVFQRHWVFAGFAQELENRNDYISFTVAGTPIIVRNTKGQLAAFRNVCSHRHSLIHPEGCGNAAFRCPFHGWTYDAAGIPVGIPDNTISFGLDMQERRALALEQLAVAQCGRLVFVRFAEDGPALDAWLGPLMAPLAAASGLFDKIYYRATEDWACNWKLGIEVTLEGYHLPTVHPASFTNYVDNRRDDAAESGEPYGHTECVGTHSFNLSPLSDMTMSRLTAIADRVQLPHGERIRSYDHSLLYPNFVIGISGGRNLYAAQYEPLAPDRTRVRFWLATGTPAEAEQYGGPLWQDMAKQWIEWTNQVMDEDRGACEKAQAGVAHALQRGLLGRVEERVRRFQSALEKDMNHA